MTAVQPQHFFESVEGWFSFRDIYEQAIAKAESTARFVEVGSWFGRSAAWMAVEIARSGKRIEFYCVDTWKGSADEPYMAEQLKSLGGSGKQCFLDNMQRGGVADIVRPIEAASTDAAMLFDDESLDFVFIDAAHDYHNVRADVRAWYPKVKPGGVIAGDDARWSGVLLGVNETIPLSEYELRNASSHWWHRKQRREYGRWLRRAASSPACDYLAYVPVVNNCELAERAVRSLEPLWPSLIVIDQSEEGLSAPWIDEVAGVYRVPFRAISFTQMMNWARSEAFARGARFLAFMHSDAECLDEDAAICAIDLARREGANGVGITFTNYDALAVFNVAALRDVGPWDESFQWYFADNDYYRRMKLCGWRIAEFGGTRVKHTPSQTLHSDSRIKAQVQESWGWHARHYEHKWGGPPGNERHHVPYNGSP